jgi:predicted nucleic acid-binding Zn ribbon protein
VRVDGLLRNVVGRLGIERNLDDYRIWAAWDEVVGPAVARNAQPIRLDKARLIVAVKNATWMQELALLRHDLCSRLNRWMDREVITEIFLIVGRVESGTQSKPAPAAAAPPAPEPRAPDVESAIERLWKAVRERDRS